MKLTTLKPSIQTLGGSIPSLNTTAAGAWRADKQGSTARGYGWKWQRARLKHLEANPLCVMCKGEDRVTAATVVDHIVPHRGDQVKFWDRSNWQSLCAHHHSSHKQRQEAQAR